MTDSPEMGGAAARLPPSPDAGPCEPGGCARPRARGDGEKLPSTAQDTSR